MECIQFLSESGSLKGGLPALVKQEELLPMYSLMVLTRFWSDKAKAMQRQGRMGTFPPPRGQEACNVGMGMALEKGVDWFVPAFREQGTMFTLGISPFKQFQLWGWDERGGAIPEGVRMLPVSVPITSQYPHATGLAYAMKYKKEKSAAMAVIGDGGTSEGDFHESLNFAAVLHLPVVFVVQNNHWAISVPLHQQMATATIAEKAAAYNIKGFRVDGNDVLAVTSILRQRMVAAKEQHEPCLVELVTYRMDDHTTADDASKYRKKEQVEAWLPRDPLIRMKAYLLSIGHTEAELLAIEQERKDQLEQAAQEYLALTPPAPESLFDHHYVNEPWSLREQRQAFLAEQGRA